MSDLQVIQSALEGAARRRRWARALRGMWQGLLVGSVLSLVFAGAYHVYPFPLWTLLIAALIPFPTMLLGLAIGGWRKPSLTEVARWVDVRQNLKERLSTALEVSSGPEAGAWGTLVVNDAATHARELDARSLVPFHLPRATRWALVSLAVAGGLGFVPEYRSKSYLQKQQDQQVIKEVGRQLTELTRRNLEKRTPALEPTQKAMEAVNEVGEKFTKLSLTRSDALKDLSNVADKLKDELKELGKDPALRRMEQAARGSAGKDAQTAAGVQKQLEAMQKQLGTPTGNPEALENLRKQVEKLQDMAKGLSSKDASAAQAEKEKLAESLSSLSRQVQDMGINLPEIDDAIKALAANQTEMLLKDLQASVNDLEKMRDMAKTMQQLQEQVEKMGKDLAEQLQNGQPEAAQMTLQKMIQQLKMANLTPEQLKQLQQEVAKAIDPAGNYGQVGQHLKNAAREMQSGNKANAAQALAAAASELEKLGQQLADAQSLSAELDALNQASMCIGMGQGWRQGKPGFKPGGKPGSGVGTWAEDENGAWKGEWSDRWDNSGIVRPDEDARGHTDRGPAELSDALKPTKVKGQFSPGGQMPSITLKGVSIKGQSKVDYEASATAAQSDAQSALSQEKVPRAYQGAVREYFDDLKK